MGAITKQSRIYVAGHRGMVGSAIVRKLMEGGFDDVIVRTRSELDLTDQRATEAFLQEVRPDYIFIAAAKVGGIHANQTLGADFIYQNLVLETNLIHGAHKAGVQRLCFLGSSCIYPRTCPQPMKESALLTAPLESTNEPYAIAKIAGIKMCEAYSKQYGRDYISVMPTNLYGPNDSYDLQNSHVIPALLRKTHEARVRGDKKLVVWGSGNPRREFLYVDDLAEACVFLMERDYTGPLLNVGMGKDATIREVAEMIMKVVGFTGEIVFDASKPDGTPQKLLDIAAIEAQGWSPRVPLSQGLKLAYDAYVASLEAR